MKNAVHCIVRGLRWGWGRDVKEKDFQEQRGLKIGGHRGEEETSDT
jgi:hypothetical protein